MVISWPQRIKPDKTPRSQFHHVNDVVPTIYEILGIQPPKVVDGHEQDPIDGTSFAYTFDSATAPERKQTQYFDIMGSRGIYHDGWMASTFGPPRTPWVADVIDISAMLDLWNDAVILEMPTFDSDYVSLMVTGYDHYVNVPMATRLGDFKKPEKMLFYSARTEGYNGEPVDGVDRIFECTGDFISAVLRIMPHSSDPERFERILEQMKRVKLTTLSEHRAGKAKPIDDVDFPPVGKTDVDILPEQPAGSDAVRVQPHDVRSEERTRSEIARCLSTSWH